MVSHFVDHTLFSFGIEFATAILWVDSKFNSIAPDPQVGGIVNDYTDISYNLLRRGKESQGGKVWPSPSVGMAWVQVLVMGNAGDVAPLIPLTRLTYK